MLSPIPAPPSWTALSATPPPPSRSHRSSTGTPPPSRSARGLQIMLRAISHQMYMSHFEYPYIIRQSYITFEANAVFLCTLPVFWIGSSSSQVRPTSGIRGQHLGWMACGLRETLFRHLIRNLLFDGHCMAKVYTLLKPISIQQISSFSGLGTRLHSA